MQRKRIFLADDHSLLLDAFGNLLESEYEIVGTATDGRQMLSMVNKLQPDVVLLDVSMPNLNGMDAGEKLKRRHPDIKIIFLTVNEDPDIVAEAFKIGASGYLLKNCAAEELFKAIETALTGGVYVSPSVNESMISSFIKNPEGRKIKDDLTIRQREVLQLIAEGKTMKEIATILSITPRTVAFHKYQIMDNLDIKSNSELIKYAIKHGIAT